MRLILTLLALFPLLAPFELLIQPYLENRLHWQAPSLFGAIFLVCVLCVSLGAVFVSCIFLLSAIFGLDQTLEVDPVEQALTLTQKIPLRKPRGQRHRFSEIKHVDLVAVEWSDGDPSYRVVVDLNDMRSLSISVNGPKEHGTEVVQQIRALLGHRPASR